jgi:hypothetical protein
MYLGPGGRLLPLPATAMLQYKAKDNKTVMRQINFFIIFSFPQDLQDLVNATHREINITLF